MDTEVIHDDPLATAAHSEDCIKAVVALKSVAKHQVTATSVYKILLLIYGLQCSLVVGAYIIVILYVVSRRRRKISSRE